MPGIAVAVVGVRGFALVCLRVVGHKAARIARFAVTIRTLRVGEVAVHTTVVVACTASVACIRLVIDITNAFLLHADSARTIICIGTSR